MRKTGKIVPFLISAGLIVGSFLFLLDSADAQLSSANVAALAIYVADVNTTDDLPNNLVNYNIVSPLLIDLILSGVEFDVERDCTGIETKNSSYMYVQFKNGSRKVYHLFLLNSHIAIKDRRDLCFFVSPEAQSLIAAHAQG